MAADRTANCATKNEINVERGGHGQKLPRTKPNSNKENRGKRTKSKVQPFRQIMLLKTNVGNKEIFSKNLTAKSTRLVNNVNISKVKNIKSVTVTDERSIKTEVTRTFTMRTASTKRTFRHRNQRDPVNVYANHELPRIENVQNHPNDEDTTKKQSNTGVTRNLRPKRNALKELNKKQTHPTEATNPVKNIQYQKCFHLPKYFFLNEILDRPKPNISALAVDKTKCLKKYSISKNTSQFGSIIIKPDNNKKQTASVMETCSFFNNAVWNFVNKISQHAFECSICDQSFSDIRNLTVHIPHHFTAEPFYCKLCNVPFPFAQFHHHLH